LLCVPVICAFGVPAADVGAKGEAGVGEPATEVTREITRPGYHQFVLLDALRCASGPAPGAGGGGGRVVDWAAARRVVDAGECVVDRGLLGGGTGVGDAVGQVPVVPLPVTLVGGLTPENVATAIVVVRPWAVDVSGDMECAGGSAKDVGHVCAFGRAAKGLVVDLE
jgi:anthranilate synthase/indole-3-glycerol phosphate synthase/phosphoribosylanthranilate isomerase